MATINFNLERAFLKGTPKEDVDRMRITKKIDPKLLHNKETAINLMINIKGKLFKISTNEHILPKYWDFVNKRAKSSYTGSFELNMVLDDLRTKLLTNLRAGQLEPGRMNIEELRDLIKNTVGNTQPDVRSIELFSAYDLFVEEKATQVKPLTIKKYRTLARTLGDFSKVKGKKLCFHHINMEFDREFKDYLVHGRGLMNNTIDKFYDNLKVFLAWAEQKGYHTSSDYKNFVSKRDDSEIIYLDSRQLGAISDLALDKNPSLDLVRDMFVFQANTGQRFSDVSHLKWPDIHVMVGGTEWHLFQIKGNKSKRITVPLTERAKDILAKYRHREVIYQKVFPAFSNVTTNRYLKEIARLAGCNTAVTIVRYNGKRRVETTKPLWNFVGTHTARRSFVTLSLERGMRPEVIQQVTGHEDYKVMKKYIKITQKVVHNELLKAWDQKAM